VVIAQSLGLIPVKVLISNSLMRLELFKDLKGNLFLSSPAVFPEGIVYYATTTALLYSFANNVITLQRLFRESPSHFVEISNKNKTALYCITEVKVQIVCGNKKINKLQPGSKLDLSSTL
jgi:hypothetical protein